MTIYPVWICRDPFCEFNGMTGHAICSDCGHQQMADYVPKSVLDECEQQRDEAEKRLEELADTASLNMLDPDTQDRLTDDFQAAIDLMNVESPAVDIGYYNCCHPSPDGKWVCTLINGHYPQTDHECRVDNIVYATWSGPNKDDLSPPDDYRAGFLADIEEMAESALERAYTEGQDVGERERKEYREAWLSRGRMINGTGEYIDDGPWAPIKETRAQTAREIVTSIKQERLARWLRRTFDDDTSEAIITMITDYIERRFETHE